ncbi:MAG: hypothetical protein MJE77_24610 [Proteobacteria bacterium]|nr:hypothetical protein [Pseudomonadota bacterium]
MLDHMSDKVVIRSKAFCLALALSLLPIASCMQDALPNQGTSRLGVMTANAMTANAMTANAMTANAMTANAMTANAMTANAMTANAMTANAMTANAMTANAMTANSLQFRGLSLSPHTHNGLSVAGVGISDVALDGLGINQVGPWGIRLGGVVLSRSDSDSIGTDDSDQSKTGLYGYSINGLYIDGNGPGSIAVNGVGLRGVGLNGFDGSGLIVDGNGLNGLGINRSALSGLATSGIALRGVDPSLLGDDDSAAAGVGLSGIGISGLFLDGSHSRSLRVGGSSLLDVSLDGLVINDAGPRGVAIIDKDGSAVPLSPEEEFIAHAVIFYLVGCALPAGSSVSITSSDDVVRSFPGKRGYAPEWQYGGVSQHGAEAVRSCLASSRGAHESAPLNDGEREQLHNALVHLVGCALPPHRSINVARADGTSTTYHGSRGFAPEWEFGAITHEGEQRVRACLKSSPAATEGQPLSAEQESNFEALLQYAVECALADGESVTIYGSDGAGREYRGIIGLAPDWARGAISPTERRLVSACLGARTNANGQSVRISLRGGGIDTTVVERAVYSRHEGGFWGDAFGDQPYINVCEAQGAGISGRVCTDGSCGFPALGSCAEVCTTRSSEDGHYDDCAGDGQVLNTFLSLTDDVAFGKAHYCYRAGKGTVWCWGQNEHGELGDGTTRSRRKAKKVTRIGRNVAEVAAGAAHTCARKNNGSVWCWGNDEHGQMGSGSAGTRALSPRRVVELGYDVASLSVGKYHGCALKADGSLWCWGGNEHGQVADSGLSVESTPVAIAELGYDVARISLGDTAKHSCAVTNTGELWCWGSNRKGQIGNGTAAHGSSPVHVSQDIDGSPFDEVTDSCTGGNHTCARRSDGSVWCWGSNHTGQVGDPTRTDYMVSRPVQTALPGKAIHGGLSCAENHTCAIDSSGSVWCWGDNKYGQLGNGTATAQSAHPVQVTGLAGRAVYVSADSDHTCISQRGKRLWCWGYDPDHMLFAGSIRYTPVEVKVSRTRTAKRRRASDSR